MKVVSVINYKGGVGKTTITANLGTRLAALGKRVLLIDLDPQASLTFSFISGEDWDKNFKHRGTIKSWFDAANANHALSLASIIHQPARVNKRLEGSGRIDAIYSHLGLINVDLDLAVGLGSANLAEGKRRFLSVHGRLAQGIERDIAPLGYDIVLIDCPPNFNIVTKTAIVASDLLLVPARPDHLSTLGIDYLLRSLRELVHSYNEYAAFPSEPSTPPIAPEILGVIFTMIEFYKCAPIRAQTQFVTKLGQDFPTLNIFDTFIRANNTLFAEASQFGIPVVLDRGTTPVVRTIVGEIEELTNEFIRRADIGGRSDR